MRLCALLVAVSLCAAPLSAASPDAAIRETFNRFVEAQNNHDAAAVRGLLLDSGDFLWITRGTAVWGVDEAIKRFETLYKGTWHLEPDMSAFRVLSSDRDLAQIFVPITFTMAPPDQAPQQTRFLMNQVFVKRGREWKVASILPIAAPAP